MEDHSLHSYFRSSILHPLFFLSALCVSAVNLAPLHYRDFFVRQLVQPVHDLVLPQQLVAYQFCSRDHRFELRPGCPARCLAKATVRHNAQFAWRNVA